MVLLLLLWGRRAALLLSEPILENGLTSDRTVLIHEVLLHLSKVHGEDVMWGGKRERTKFLGLSR